MESEGARNRGGESGARERVQEWRERKGARVDRKGRERGGREVARKKWGESAAREGTRGVKEREKGARKRWCESGEREKGRDWREGAWRERGA